MRRMKDKESMERKEEERPSRHLALENRQRLKLLDTLYHTVSEEKAETDSRTAPHLC